MVQIDELHLRLPHVTEEQGQRSAHNIAGRLADLLPPESSDQYISEIRIKMNQPEAMDQSVMEERVVAEIMKRINII